MTSRTNNVHIADKESKNIQENDRVTCEKTKDEKGYSVQIVWRNVIFMIYLHIGALVGAYLLFKVRYVSKIWCEYHSMY